MIDTDSSDQAELSTSPPLSRHYRFVRLLSSHGPFQAWEARRLGSGEPCFVKRIDPRGDVNGSAAVAAQLAAARLQGAVRCPWVGVCRRHLSEGDVLLVEYPYLDPRSWEPLTPALVLEDPSRILMQMCRAVDFLHMSGLVHGDLKIENFVASTSLPRQIKLVDLDFLCARGAMRNATLCGTEPYLAPELRTDPRVDIEADQYSLGRSLKNALADWIETQHDMRGDLVESVGRFADEIACLRAASRPRQLLGALRNAGVITVGQWLRAARTLLGRMILGAVRTGGRQRAARPQPLRRLVHHRLRILGPRPELIAEVGRGLESSPVRTLRLVLRSLGRAQLLSYGEYWHITLDDAALLRLYRELERVRSSGDGGIDSVRIDPAPGSSGNGAIERQFLELQSVLEADGPAPRKDVAVLAQRAGRLAEQLGRLPDAAGLYERALSACTDRSDRWPLLYQTALAVLKVGDLGRAAELLSTAPLATESADGCGPTVEIRLQLERLRAWIDLHTGHAVEARDSLHRIAREAATRRLPLVGALAVCSVGIADWIDGDFAAAQVRLEEALQVARQGGVLNDSLNIAMTLGLVCNEMGNYLAGLNYAKLAVDAAQLSHQTHVLPAVYLQMVHSCARLARFRRAEYWLERSLEVSHSGDPTSLYLSFYLEAGTLQTLRGDLREADRSLAVAASLPVPTGRAKLRGKIYHNLAELALMRGDATGLAENCRLAAMQFESAGDKAAWAEVEVLRLAGLTVAECPDRRSRLETCIASLLKLNCLYAAAQGAYTLLLESDDGGWPGIAGNVVSIIQERSSQEVPLFAALTGVYEASDGEAPSAWKRALVALSAGRQPYCAALTALKLGDLYRRLGRTKHARKYYAQVEDVARGLGNEQLAIRARQGIESLSTGGQREPVVESMYVISELLTNVGDYEATLGVMMRFAIEETGAERGILFLRRVDQPGLYPAVVQNCDAASIDELADFSSQLPLQTLEQASPLFIANALNDQRTNRYASIVRHNILSVACVPLAYEGEVLGVLYLDHHSIPSLFDKSDLKYVTALSNFLAVALRTSRQVRGLVHQRAQLLEDLGRPSKFISRDPVIAALLDKLPQIAASAASVLITGESGTGKETLAETIHRLSARAEGPMIKFNCASLAPTLVESELFGIVRGAATEVSERVGRFAAAEGGTLFLDEIGDMPLAVQAKVLRAIENRQFERVGSNRPTHVDVRFVAATNRNLKEMIAAGTFRADLFYRINTVVIDVPPLRERPDDIPLLVEHFSRLLPAEMRRSCFDDAAMRLLLRYSWPGNAREVRNLVERCAILYPGQVISPAQLPEEIVSQPSRRMATEGAGAMEQERIRQALAQCRGNQRQTAAVLNIPVSTLRRKLKKMGLLPA